MPISIQFTCITPLQVSHKTFGLYIFFWNLERYCITLAKPRRKAIPKSFYNNIVNHETKTFFKRYLFHVHYIMLDILIQLNEGNAKFFTLMVECFT
jgi:hypothetical protein